ncbi:MAG TPA: hypothetical protein VE732_04870, partial [Nitrososphaera sp.]|nr:hypothetical protein [Nitrososphaera sp.]
MNDEERRYIIDLVLGTVIKEWKDTSVAALKEQDGAYVFTFTFKHSAFHINARGMIEDVLMEFYRRDLAVDGSLTDAERAIRNQDLYYTT